ncbi:hypothetical protein [Nocardia sp. NBC_01377]|uniref:hypothetical protein n=1 Tax=Nocardia sp. NBC_01377 TaxID=2903595 RepID=UPI00386A53CA
MAQPREQASVCPQFNLWSMPERTGHLHNAARDRTDQQPSLRPTQCPASHEHKPCSDAQEITREPNAATLRENVEVSAIGNEIRYELDEPAIGESTATTELDGG